MPETFRQSNAASDYLREINRSLATRLDRLDAALVHVWRDLSETSARAYVRALRLMLELERQDQHYERDLIDLVPQYAKVGPWKCSAILGVGSNGQAFASRHQATGKLATIKTNSRMEGPVAEWLAESLPPEFLRIYDQGALSPAEHGIRGQWVAREPADGTWADYLEGHGGHVPDLSESLSIFATACRGVSAMHELRVYRWSAHARNVFRVGGCWRLGDLGRSVVAADPRYAYMFAPGADMYSSVWLSAGAGPWESQDSAGTFAFDQTRETRLKLDDLSMLAGLLMDLMGVNRWETFRRAVQPSELCSQRYVVTGRGETDRKLSRVLNRAWLGDGGGALAVAAGQPFTAGYTDARELLADVEHALVST